MAGIRENILVNSSVRDAFLQAMVDLDNEASGVTAGQLFAFLQDNGIPLQMAGIDQEVSTYDLFVFWHVAAMSVPLAPGNAAHSGPIFLPWHRMFLIRLEEQMQRVLGDADFGLPYWDWAADGELPRGDQWRTILWTADYIGEARGFVRSGPLSAMQVRLAQDSQSGILWSVQPRSLIRSAGLDSAALDLPNQAEEQVARNQFTYDMPPWGRFIDGHRNRLEGWWFNGPQLHNRVHVWIGGDMAPGSSPNDPVFFLNHCNVDRLWEEWMANNGQQYQPAGNTGPQGHRLNDTMFSILGGNAMTPATVLDPSQWYAYDTLFVA